MQPPPPQHKIVQGLALVLTRLAPCAWMLASCTEPTGNVGASKDTHTSDSSFPESNTDVAGSSGQSPAPSPGDVDTGGDENSGGPEHPEGDKNPNGDGGAAACRNDADCTDLRRPACDTTRGICVRCTDSKRHCLDPAAPLCGKIEGEPSCQPCFVREDCADDNAGSYCHIDTSASPVRSRCVACLEHAHCSSPLQSRCQVEEGLFTCAPCNEVEGQCPGEQTCLFHEQDSGVCTKRVLYVEENGDCDNATGSKDQPFCRLIDALPHLTAKEPTTIQMPLGDQTRLGIEVGGEVMISLTGRGDFLPMLALQENSRVSVHGLNYNGGVAMRESSKLRLSEVRSTSLWSFDIGEQSGVWVDRSSLVSDGVALGSPLFELDDAHMHITNSVIAGHYITSKTPQEDELALFKLGGGSELRLEHVTMVDNNLDATAPLFRCLDRGSSIELHSSLVLDGQKSSEILCTSEQLTRRHILSDLRRLLGEESVEWTSIKWKPYFRDPEHGDFGLSERFDDTKDPTWRKILSTGHWSPGQRHWDLDGALWSPGPGCVGADQFEGPGA